MTRPDPADRPTARELAAQSNGTDPWACPRCGCKDSRVIDSRFDGAQRNRKRVCRHCKQSFPTVEIPCPPGHKLVAVPDDQQLP